MPLYEYECDACGNRFEVIRKFSDPPLEACTKCGKSPVRRLQSSPAIQFKGTGWYITDYSQKGKGGGESSASSKNEKNDKNDTKKTDSGSADTAATKSDTAPASAPPKPSSSES
ncbi:MAG TPA: FmdB family zinc ribbon protein [Vicinamibacterales bacterium]|nr:FmdB family zinc ribbon protein [Vicinamibacterales bacterium]